MRKQIQLSIPEPCHEHWDNMLPAEKGRFCGSCQKQVIDFTGMSDEQLALFFKKATTTGVCGRFMHHQLDRAIDMPKKRIPWMKYFFQFALPAFLVSAKAAAQGTVRVVKGDTLVIEQPKILEIEKVKEAMPRKQISGKVVDENGNGVPYASVIIKGSMMGTATDTNGNFTLDFPGNIDSLVLISSSVGYQVAEKAIDLNENNRQIIIPMNYNTLEGLVVSASGLTRLEGFVGGLTVKKISIIDTICNKVFASKKPALKLYPNPLKGETSLTIEIDKNKKGTYVVQVATLSGQIICHQENWMDKNDRLIKINLPSVAAGTYLVSVINKESGKAKTEKLIIE